MKRLLILCMGLMISGATLAADPVNGKKLSAQCSVCHGKNGISKYPEAPNLAGMSSLYFEKSMVDYQKGERHDRRMSLIAKNLSKEQIRDLAAWYASFEVTVTIPEL